MKKIIIAAVALLCSSTSIMALDNEPEPGFTHRVYAGMSIANLRNTGLSPKVGQSIGWIGEFTLPGCAGAYVNGGLEYNMLGAKDKNFYKESYNPIFDDYTEKKVTDKLRTHYITVPIHGGFRYNVLDNLGVYADFGPYFALGLAGKTSESDVKWFKNGKSYNCGNAHRFDCGLGFRLGAEYNNHLSLTFAFNWGLCEVADFWKEVQVPSFDWYDLDYDYDYVDIPTKAKNFYTTITVGYRF